MVSSESRPLLLDVNALLALAWPNHQFHRTVLSRLERRPAPEWATCALTQLGFVRLSSNPTIVGVRQTPRLQTAGQLPDQVVLPTGLPHRRPRLAAGDHRSQSIMSA